MTEDWFDNFLLMAGKIWVESTDTGFVGQSNDEAIKRCMCGYYVELWSPIKARELVRN